MLTRRRGSFSGREILLHKCGDASRGQGGAARYDAGRSEGLALGVAGAVSEPLAGTAIVDGEVHGSLLVAIVQGDNHPASVSIAVGADHETVRVFRSLNIVTHGARPDETAVVAKSPEQAGVAGLLRAVVDADESVLVVAATGAPPRPALGVSMAEVVMDDAGDIESRLHREVVATATAYLLVVRHDAELRLPERDAVMAAGVAQLLAYAFHVRYGRVRPVAVPKDEVGHLWRVAEECLRAVLGEERADGVATLPVGLVNA